MTHEELETMMPEVRRAVLKTAKRYFGHSGEAAEDVAQECCMRLWLRCEAMQRGEVEALAHAIARNLCVSEHRRVSRSAVTRPILPEKSHERTPATNAIEGDNSRLLQEALSSLPAAWQRLLRMKAETSMRTRQMATVLGIKPESVSAMLSAARRRLYEKLKIHIQP